MSEFRTCRGRIRSALIVAVSGLALISLSLTGLPDAIRVSIGSGVVFAAWLAVRRAPDHRIRLPAAGPAMLDGRTGSLSAAAVSPLYVSLALKSPTGEQYRAGIFRDELRAEEFRALLAWLRAG
jgi:hypothetical protein